MAYQDLGRKKLLEVCEALGDAGTPEGVPRMEGRMMGILLAPTKKRAKPKSSGPSSVPEAEGTPTDEGKSAEGSVATESAAS